LQALRAKFNLLVDSRTKAAAAGVQRRRAVRRSSGSGIVRGGLASVASFGSSDEESGGDSVLTYEGFLGFWAEAGLKDWLTKVCEGLDKVPMQMHIFRKHMQLDLGCALMRYHEGFSGRSKGLALSCRRPVHVPILLLL
jgi:hypothetical protein